MTDSPKSPSTPPKNQQTGDETMFADRDNPLTVEQGNLFSPKFDSDGLIPAIVTEVGQAQVLMFAFMDAKALQLSISTRQAHFFSRSRNRLWKKGEESGNTLQIETMRTDCDQDVVWLSVRVQGNGVACHTGEKSCFYRSVDLESEVSRPVHLTRD
ncbi:MAG: phosphoribosyl-AMP cyclohydrolase [Pseudomonadota bacterium]